jgi:hypothetical protein
MSSEYAEKNYEIFSITWINTLPPVQDLFKISKDYLKGFFFSILSYLIKSILQFKLYNCFKNSYLQYKNSKLHHQLRIVFIFVLHNRALEMTNSLNLNHVCVRVDIDFSCDRLTNEYNKLNKIEHEA